ncbi:MAG: outer membrane protein assembly factor BamB [Phycisphaerales bacterium]|nr:outer membrane protein assembly factor BamB [Phycisphaerales bacterium]
MMKRIAIVGVVAALLAGRVLAADEKSDIVVDKEKKTVTVAAKIAPRKINDPRFTEIYPIEVVACAEFPKGQKAHETVITVDAKPSEVHKALESLGLKAGKPATPGGEESVAEGPLLKISLELPNGKSIPIEKTLIDKKTGKTMPPLKWHFTGSAMKQLDPNKPDQSYGADTTLTLIGIFPVTNETVIQSNLTMKDEPIVKMETNKAILPPEGTAVKLLITPATGK